MMERQTHETLFMSINIHITSLREVPCQAKGYSAYILSDGRERGWKVFCCVVDSLWKNGESTSQH